MKINSKNYMSSIMGQAAVYHAVYGSRIKYSSIFLGINIVHAISFSPCLQCSGMRSKLGTKSTGCAVLSGC